MPLKKSVSDYINKKKYCAYACVNPDDLVGPQGPEGPEGPQGPEGPPGADGQTVLNGVVDPTTEGNDGDFYINTATETIFGPKTGGAWGAGTSLVGPPGPAGSSLQTLQYSINLDIRSVSNEFFFVGVNDSVATLQNGDFTTPFSAYNNHVYLKIIAASVSGTPSVSITGTAISESTGIPTNTTETFNLNPTAVGEYQSINKWYVVTSITFTNTTPSNYDISVLGYLDFLNTDVKIIGYRMEILGDDNSSNSDINFQIIKVDNGTDNIISLIDLENITIDGNGGANGTGQITDVLRSSRDFTMPTGTNLWPAGTDFVIKQTDFDTFFTSDQNHILGSSNEGILVKISSSQDFDSGNAPRYIAVYIFYENL